MKMVRFSQSHVTLTAHAESHMRYMPAMHCLACSVHSHFTFRPILHEVRRLGRIYYLSPRMTDDHQQTAGGLSPHRFVEEANMSRI